MTPSKNLRRSAMIVAVAALLAAWTATATTVGAATPKPGIDAAGLSAGIKPCHDFYAFANQQWLGKTKIPDDRSAWGTFYEIDQRNESILKNLLVEGARDPSLPEASPGRKVADYYASGMNTARIEKAGLAPLRPEFERIQRMKNTDDLVAELARLQRMGVGAGLSFGIDQDAKDSTRYWPEIRQGGLGLPDRDYYFAKDKKSRLQREQYLRHVARMFTLMGEKPATAKALAAKVMRLETRLAGASMTKVEQRDPNAVYNKMTLTQLNDTAPGIDWARFFTTVGVNSVKDFNVAQPKFFKELAQSMNDLALADWKAYLRWQLVSAAAPRLSSAFEKENFAFYGATLSGKKTQLPRAKRIIDAINGRYGHEPLAHALGELYVERAFPPEAKAKALELVTNVKAALADRILQLDWMSQPTKARAQQKLAAMKVKIGYPDEWRGYSALEIDRDSYVSKWFRVNEFGLQRELNKLGRPIDRNEWWMAPQTVNAYYSAQLNEIVFPAGILQPPFFDPRADDAVNYGAIGMIIGHEITHGFDDQGRQFDADGNLKDWWQPEDAERYASKAAVVEQQFNQYEGVEGLKVNGKLTLGENIADLGGLKIAYLALQKALANKKVGLIDGFTQDQRFFISFAQGWRAKYRPQQERLQITTDPHSPPRFRVRGPLANSPEFAQAFSCQAADTALRKQDQRVTIW